ncbi:MAG: dihydroneopterin aldolase [Elusimicrobia bacterium]|nr:dihydroneopterin aldolase [Elusimicrobiota bacterium]
MISDVELFLRMGCTPEERAFPQRILLDVALELPLQDAGQRDDVSLTVDYAVAVSNLKKQLEPKVFHLMEAAAEEAARIVLANRLVRTVSVRVKKKALPGIGHAEVEITRAFQERKDVD